jgi:hypothetical protein
VVWNLKLIKMQQLNLKNLAVKLPFSEIEGTERNSNKNQGRIKVGLI